MKVICNKCSKDAPIIKDDSKIWTVYKTDEPCECGGKFVPDFLVTKERGEMKAIKITTNDVISVVDIQEPTLKGMQEQVGGYIQTVRGYPLNTLPVSSKLNLLMIVNEEGKQKKLPFNEVATDLVDEDVIVGDVLIMAEGFVNGETDIVGLTNEQVDALVNVFEYDFDMEVRK